MSRHAKTPLRVSMLAILAGIIGMLLFFGGATRHSQQQKPSRLTPPPSRLVLLPGRHRALSPRQQPPTTKISLRLVSQWR